MSNDHPNGHPPHPAPPPQQGPYAPPGPQYAPPGQPGQPGPYPQPGAYAPPGAPYAPHAPTAPLAMPGPVRAAQVVIFVMAGLAVLLTALVAGGSGAESAGRYFAMYLMTVPLFVLAFRYATAGNGVRVASIVLASVQIVIALGATGRGTAGAFLPLAGTIALLFMLTPASSRAWFRRNSDGVPPQAPYGPYGT
ncbi:hypothetical protein [Streptomyces sp. DH24]|uniref:hypothetical protein n=1 Tax=Streptomyces sp. DH24 TaxID=3040123 RepID=UPI002441686D|nr:hypothetical protein [Streptomyces sp. DH24]MDG9716366.1 hypothetical protein [Streptomyces sp. DH24]